MKKKISILLTLVMILNIALTFSVSAEEGVPGYGDETNPYFWVVAGSTPYLDSSNFTEEVNSKTLESDFIAVSLFLNNTTTASGGKIILDYDETKVEPMTYYLSGRDYLWGNATQAGLSESANKAFVYSGKWATPGVSFTKDKYYLSIPNGHLPITWYSDTPVNSTQYSMQIGVVAFHFINGNTRDKMDANTFKILESDGYEGLSYEYTTKTYSTQIAQDVGSGNVQFYNKDTTPAVGKTYVTINNNTYTYPANEEPSASPSASAEPSATPKYDIPVYQVVVDKDSNEISGTKELVGTIPQIEEGQVVSIDSDDTPNHYDSAYFTKETVEGISYNYSENLSKPTLSVQSAANAQIVVKFERFTDVTVNYVLSTNESTILKTETLTGKEIGETASVEPAQSFIHTTDGYTYTYVESTTSVEVAKGATITLKYAKVPHNYTVTIKYVDEQGQTIKNDTAVSNVVENTPFDISPYDDEFTSTIDSKTYTFLSANPESVTVTDNVTITLTFAVKTARLTINYVDKDGITLKTVEKDVPVELPYTASGTDLNTITVGDTTYEFDAEATESLTVNVPAGGATLTLVYKETQQASGNNNLESIWTEPKQFKVNSFSPDVTEYDNIKVKPGFATYVIAGYAADEGATVTYSSDGTTFVGGNYINFTIGRDETKTITIRVTAANGDVKDYHFNFTGHEKLAVTTIDRIFVSGVDVNTFVKDAGAAFEFDAIRGYASYVLKAFATDNKAKVQYAVVNTIEDVAGASFVSGSGNDGIISMSLATDSSKVIAVKVTADDGVASAIYTFKFDLPKDTNTQLVGYFISGFEAMSADDINSINTTGVTNLNYLPGYANYVFQYRSSIYAKVEYAFDNSNTTPATFSSATNYIIVPRAQMAVGKSIYVKVTAESGASDIYEFKLAQ